MVIQFDADAGSVSVPREFRELLREMGRGGRMLRVTIVQAREARTLQQNAKFHCQLQRLSALSGYGMEGLKEYVKQEAIALGYPMMADGEGTLVLDREGHPLGKPSHLADTFEMGILIDAAYLVAGRWGLDITQEGAKL